MTEEEYNADFEPFIATTPKSSGMSMVTYFQNLYTYSPVNSHGSCGYVSFIQYLSYYDTFRNDNIIPTVYERSQGSVSSLEIALSDSSGVCRQSYPQTGLYDFIQKNRSTDFQMYLMEIVNSSMGNEASEYSCDIGMWSYYKILRVLFPDTTVHFDYFCVSDFGVAAKPTDANVINGFDAYVKEQLDLGNPVMLHIADYNEETGVREGYHSVVAYYYDEYGIHAHFGWNRSSSDTVITTNYQITEAGVMDLTNIPETHSNNYVVNNVEYCGCGLQTHIHNYEDHYCTMCNQYTETHDYHDPYIWVDFSKHDATCGCGATTQQGHAVSSSGGSLLGIGTRYKTCLLCGGSAEIGFVQLNATSTEIKYVTEKGSYILPNGVIVLVDENIEAYMNHTLVFQKKNNSLTTE